MGAMFSLFLMIIIFLSALFCIVLNLILIVIWKIKKRRGKNPKKRYLIIVTIFLIISILVELIPIGWVGFLRIANSSMSKDIVKAESGKIVYWGTTGNGDATIGKFELDGTHYVELDLGGSIDTWRLGKPIANIRFKSDEKGLNKMMSFLFARDNTSTLYPIINKNKFKLFTIGSNIYCPENQENLIFAYYKDISNYDTINCKFNYSIYIENNNNDPEKKDEGRKEGINYINKYQNVTLKQGVYDKLLQIQNSQAPETIKISEKYRETSEARKPGTPIFGYKNVYLYAYSKDGVASKVVYLDLIDNKVYCETESGYGYIKGFSLSDEIEKYLKDIIFQEKK